MQAGEQPPAGRGNADDLARYGEVVRKFIEMNGAEALEIALRLGEMLKSVRDTSRFSIKTAVDAHDSGLSSALIFQFRPRASKAGERVEARVVLGESHQLVLAFQE